MYNLETDFQTVLTFVQITEPRAEYLKKNGAKYVIESWSGNDKILFTGLIPFAQSQFYGDYKNPYTGKRHLITIEFKDVKVTARLTIYPFDFKTNREREAYLNKKSRYANATANSSNNNTKDND